MLAHSILNKGPEMSDFDVAHINEQGVNLIIIPLESSFGLKSQEDQTAITNELQLCAASAGLAGTVVPVWDGGLGRMAFLAPPPFHPFFRSIDLSFVAHHLNRRLSCG